MVIAMNLLSLIIIFLALVVVGSIAYIAWDLTSEDMMPRSDKKEPGDSQESNE
jgi:hypothetical protein